MQHRKTNIIPSQSGSALSNFSQQGINGTPDQSGLIKVYNYDMSSPLEYIKIMRTMPGSMYYKGLQRGENGQFEEPSVYIASGPKPPSKELAWYDNRDWDNRLIYRIVEGKTIPQVVQKTLEQMGFIEWDSETHSEDQWNLLWKSQRPSLGEYKRAQPYQKLIHIPKTGSICTKDNLARVIKKMR